MTGHGGLQTLEAVLDAALLPQGLTRARRGVAWRRSAGDVKQQVSPRAIDAESS